MSECATIILWQGQYRNDGLERLENLSPSIDRWLRDPRLVGEPSNWLLIAEARLYEPVTDAV